jgi:hypothetical protein
MSNRAEFQKSYLTRYLILAAVCLFMAAWFAYDGFIGYPQQLQYAEAYDELRDMEAASRVERWKEVSSQRGWPSDIPKKTADEIRSDITGQYVWGGLNLLAGLPALLFFLRCRGSWVEATDDGLTTSWGQTMRYADVTQLDKRRWQRKGIAKATYTSSEQGTRVFVFDDFKFQREPLGKMLRDLEQVLAPEKIVGGPPESDPGSTLATDEQALDETAPGEHDALRHDAEPKAGPTK